MKNRKGSTLVIVLMVFAVLSILATVTLSFMLTENKQSIHQKNKIEAYYIARSGAEATEAAIREIYEEADKEIERLKEKIVTLKNDEENYTSKKSNLESLILKEFTKKEKIIEIAESGSGRIEINKRGFGRDKLESISLKTENNSIIIEAIGNVNNSREKVIKVISIKNKDTSKEIELDKAIFSLGNIKLTNGEIKGDIGSNALVTVPNGNPTIDGNIYTIKEEDFTAPKWWIRDKWNNKSKVKKLFEKRTYELIKFPRFPINNSDRNFNLSGNNNEIINQSMNYNDFKINSNTKLLIDTTNSDIILNIKNFNLLNGDIVIRGDNKLIIYAGNMSIGSASTINYKKEESFNKWPNKLKEGGNEKQVDIYYENSEELIFSGNQKVRGNIFIKNAPLKITGSASILGNVFSNGGNIKLLGSGDITKGILYAPNSAISFTGSGKVYGSVVGDSIEISGAGSVIYKSEYIDSEYIKIPSNNKKIILNKSYYK